MIDGLPLLEFSGPTALGLIALLVITEKLIWHKRHEEVKRENDALREQNSELLKQNSLLMGSAVPAASSIMHALHQALENEER